MTDFSWTPLATEEALRRLRTVVPGDSNPQIRTDGSIVFSHLSMDAVKEMHEYSKDERLYQYMEGSSHKTLDETKEYLEGLMQREILRPGGKHAKYWFLRDATSGQLLGSAGLVNLDLGRYSVEWGFAIDPKLWGMGHVNELCRIMKSYVFETLQLNRLWGQTMRTNDRSIALLKNVGMRDEGILKEFYFSKKTKQFYDAWLYCITATEYHSDKKQNLELTAKGSGRVIELEAVASVIRGFLQDPDLEFDSGFSESLNWDSISHIDLLVAVESKFSIKFAPKDVSRLNSIRHFYSVITERENNIS